MTAFAHRFCVAPMMDRTDRHCRVLHRLLSRRAVLYTEMLTTGAVVHGDRSRLMDFDPREHPVALQLGGAEPLALAEAARIGASWGYDEINLNVGCPSDRVQSGRFGACLMAQPGLVADCARAMGRASDVPVTVKCRIGIDDQDPEIDLPEFAARMADAGCRTLIVHARKAWLDGLSPRDNRDVPPLDYDLVYRLKARFPQLEIVINGGITNCNEASAHLASVDGVMLGRAAYQNPYLLAEVDRKFFNDQRPALSRSAVARQYIEYMRTQSQAGTPLRAMARHLMGLYQGCRGARGFRRLLSEEVCRPGGGLDAVRDFIEALDSAGDHSLRAAV